MKFLFDMELTQFVAVLSHKEPIFRFHAPEIMTRLNEASGCDTRSNWDRRIERQQAIVCFVHTPSFVKVNEHDRDHLASRNSSAESRGCRNDPYKHISCTNIPVNITCLVHASQSVSNNLEDSCTVFDRNIVGHPPLVGARSL